MTTATNRGAGALRDNSPEQLEAMLHVARECSDMERVLRPQRVLMDDESTEARMQCLRAAERPLPRWVHAAVWLLILAAGVALAFAPVAFARA